MRFKKLTGELAKVTHHKWSEHEPAHEAVRRALAQEGVTHIYVEARSETKSREDDASD